MKFFEVSLHQDDNPNFYVHYAAPDLTYIKLPAPMELYFEFA